MILKGQKLKSWHVALLGIILQVVFGLMLLSGIEGAPVFGGIILAVGGILVLLASLLGIIPLLLLFFKRTKKIGAVISIIFGLIGTATQFGIIVGIFLIAAGILYLWKKI